VARRETLFHPEKDPSPACYAADRLGEPPSREENNLAQKVHNAHGALCAAPPYPRIDIDLRGVTVVIPIGWSSSQASHQSFPAHERRHLSACAPFLTGRFIRYCTVRKGSFPYVAKGKEAS